MDYTFDPLYHIAQYGFHGGNHGSWQVDSVDMQRTESQSTSCSVDSHATAATSTSRNSLATDCSSLDPELTKFDLDLTKDGVYMETAASHTGRPSSHGLFAIDETLVATGSHLQEVPQTQTLVLADCLPQYSTQASLQGAAWDATLTAQSWISNQCWFDDQGPPYITNQAVDEALEGFQGQAQDPPARRAVQKVLKTKLSSHFSSEDPSDSVTTSILQHAAYQLQIRLEGPEVINICYYAILTILTQLANPELANLDLDNPEPINQYSDDSAPVPAPTDASKERFRCPYRGCDKGASRQADLDRHVRIVHLADEKKPKFQCDYKRCSRHTNPFLRQDHFRDHLRTFHLEDILRRGNPGNEEWWLKRSKRAMQGGWWRCSRCLLRVAQAEHGWLCAGCGNPCEKERREYRSRAALPADGVYSGGRRERGRGERSR